MPTAVAKSKGSPEQVLAEMADFTPKQLQKVIEGAAILRLQKQGRVLPERESQLFRIINRGLDSVTYSRMELLREKNRDEIITERERNELLEISDELEKMAVVRLKALSELAVIRKTTVAKLIDELELAQSSYA